MSPPPIFVINLDRDAERMAAIARRLGAFSLPFERVPAVFGAALSLEELERQRPDPLYWVHRRPFTLGEVGCALSHQKALRAIVERGLPHAIILEDDVILADDFGQVAAALPALTDRFDLVKFEGLVWEDIVSPYVQRDIGDFFGRRLLLPRYPAVGSAGYFVTQKAAAVLAEAAAPLTQPYDWVLVDYPRNRLRFAEIYPHPAWQETLSTSMEQDRAVQVHKPTPAYKLRKKLRKAGERIRQRLYEIEHLGPWTLWTPSQKIRRKPIPPADSGAAA